MPTSLRSRHLFAFASALLALPALIFAAAPKVEETIIGPTTDGGVFTVSLDGAHVAYVGKKGAHYYVNVDGVAGPEFDAIYKTSGPEFYFPPKAGAARAPEHPDDGNDAPVRFSGDGAHYTYMARLGDQCVVIHDGKEVGRFPANTRTSYGAARLSPGGKHVYWNEGKTEQARGVGRLVIDGKPTEWGMLPKPVFSPDDEQYAWEISVQAPGERFAKSLIHLNGKSTGYEGQSPVFTADSKSLLVVSNANGASLLMDGKPVITGMQVTKVVVGPVGKRYAAIVRQKEGNGFVDYLYLDGKQVPDSHYAQDVWFSPDGKRYAAVCRNPMGGTPPAIIIDGDAYEFARIDAAPPLWTPDSSRVIFSGGTAEGSFLAVNDDIFQFDRSLRAPVVPQQGNRYAWGEVGNGGFGATLIVDGKSVLMNGFHPTSNLLFSPDGSRYGFTVARAGRADTSGLVIDGELFSGFTPGSFGQWLGSTLDALTPLAFSPDGKHYAFMGITPGSPQPSLYLNGNVIQARAGMVHYPTFTADSRHFYWIAPEPGSRPEAVSVVYVDGQPAVKGYAYFFKELKNTFVVDRAGVATFLAVDGDVVKRFRITPPADTSVATLLAAGTTAVAAAPAAPATPPPAAANPPKPSAPVAATPPTTTAAKPATPPAPAGPVTPLTWNDLVRRPETRPTACAVNKDYRFQNGAVVRAGTTVSILDVRAGNLLVGTPDGRIRFDAKPEETDVLAVANAAWAQLTPAQRDLTFAALLQRMDLWPYIVNLTDVVRLEGQTLAAGEPVQFLGFEGQQPLVRHAASGVLFNAEMSQINLMAKARALVASETGAPGRLLEELTAAHLVSPRTGQPIALDLNSRPKYVVLYRGAGWCGPCQAFSPELVKVLTEKAPAAADVQLIYVSADNNATEARAYTTKIGIDWPTIYYKNTAQLPAFNALFGQSIPQLVVTDRHGKVVVDSAQVGQQRALQQLAGLL